MSSITSDATAEHVAAAVGEAEVIVGIPSFNNGGTIAHVAKVAVEGLAEHFPGRRVLVLNSDGGSPDGTPQRMMEAAEAARLRLDRPDDVRVATLRYSGISGKGSAFRDIFRVVAKTQARAVVLLDADLRSVTPAWIASLAAPIVNEGFDFVAPLYRRHKFDGTITNSIIYPITHALYGGNVRQPIGGDFGVGAPLVRAYLDDDVWDTDVARFGIDIWMTTTALAGGHRVGQAHLGAKVHDPKDPGQHLANMLVQVVGTAFWLMERYEKSWLAGSSASDAPRLGDAAPVTIDPVRVHVLGMYEQFRFGVETLAPVYEGCLPAALWQRIVELARSNGAIPFDDVTWTRTVHAFALAHHRRLIARDQLLRSLTPLYLGRVASFIAANTDRPDEKAEEDVEQLARTFRSLAPELVDAWRGGGNAG